MKPMPPMLPISPATPMTDELTLDDDTLAWLSEAVKPEPFNELQALRIKRRLLARIADAQRSHHLTVQADEGRWKPFGPGLNIKVLHSAGGVMSYLLRLDPGATLPAHRHPVDEECMVLEGSLRIGDLHVPAGGFHLGRKDTLHMHIVSVEGALIYLCGATPQASLLV